MSPSLGIALQGVWQNGSYTSGEVLHLWQMSGQRKSEDGVVKARQGTNEQEVSATARQTLGGGDTRSKDDGLLDSQHGAR